MNREQTKDFILKCLTENDKNKDLHYKKMKWHINSTNSDDIYTAPVNPRYMEVDHTPIIMADNVFDSLELIDNYNLEKGKEVPFIIYGKRTKGGAIYLDDLYCNFDKLKESTATFQKLGEFLQLRMDVFIQDDMRDQVIVLGHTHPNTGRISFNYSVADLIVHLDYFAYNVFTQTARGNLLLSLVKTVSQDYNFIVYDPQKQVWKSYDKVYRQEKKKDFIPLSALKYCDD